ncbi:3-keto-disaccharide hydrolase [Maribellus sediminis]|uniref:3-keto-disaccharide hydrolase n=1 Tax=Maribellus sediminis TaxID=2696285 RepID=UPI00142F7298|nr:DUF1080 domain-containing protein [Maribellus sediminis]
MKHLISIIIIFFGFVSCNQQKEEGWTNLLDLDLSQWDRYLSYSFTNSYDGSMPKDDAGNAIQPIGLNKDGYKVFTVIEEENEPVLKVSGEIYGCVVTKQEYENYHFRLKVKWGDKKYPPREKLLKDSGIMYHSIGELGTDYWRTWMLSQEFQIMEGHMGDFWSQQTSAIDVRAYMPEYIMNPVAGFDQPFLKLGTGEDIDGFCLRSGNYENSPGEWNTLELICFEDKSIHIVNGHVVMVLKHSRYINNGKTLPLTKGKIQLQSEATEVFYKDIEIKILDDLPSAYLKFYE